VRGRRAEKEHGGQQAQALGRSRGGFSTKIHAAMDALGNPLRFILTGGECHESSHARALIEGYPMKVLIGDKGYDAADFIKALLAAGVEAVIPARVNRTEQHEYDKHLYPERHLVECFINKIKHYRRVFSRFEKLAKNYLGFLSFVSALVWLR
jgi:transposase